MVREILSIKTDTGLGDKNPSFHNIEITEYTFSSTRMGIPTLTATVMYDTCLDSEWTGDEYVTLRGERYYIRNTPSSSKSNTDMRFKHEINFKPERAEKLSSIYFEDVVPSWSETKDKPCSNSTIFTFYGTIAEYLDRLNCAFLKAGVGDSILKTKTSLTTLDQPKGDGYCAMLDPFGSYDPAVTKELSFSDTYLWDAITQGYETFEIPFEFRGMGMVWGAVSKVVDHTFKYGADEALLSINKNNANARIINRITFKGSSDNLPYYYPNEEEYPHTRLLFTDGSAMNDTNTKIKDIRLLYARLAQNTPVTLEKDVIEPTTIKIPESTGFKVELEKTVNERTGLTIDGKMEKDNDGDGYFGTSKTRYHFDVIANDPVSFYIKVKFDFEIPKTDFYNIERLDASIWKPQMPTLNGGIGGNIIAGNQYDLVGAQDGAYIMDLYKYGESTIPEKHLSGIKQSDGSFNLHEQKPGKYRADIIIRIKGSTKLEGAFPHKKAMLILNYAEIANEQTERKEIYRWRQGANTFASPLAFGVSVTLDNLDMALGDSLQWTSDGYMMPMQTNLVPPKYRETLGAERFYNAVNARNLMSNTDIKRVITTTADGDHFTVYSDMTAYLEKGKTYTISVETNAAVLDSSHGIYQDHCVLWLVSDNNSPQGSINRLLRGNIFDNGNRKGLTFQWNDVSGTYMLRVNFYIAGTWWVDRVMLEEGRNTKPVWEPSMNKHPEYIDPDTGKPYHFANPYKEGDPREYIYINDDIKPTIVGVENSHGQPFGEFVDVAFDQNDNDAASHDANGDMTYAHSFFYVKLNVFDGPYGFDLFKAVSQSEEMTIQMTSGPCNGCKFKVQGIEFTDENGASYYANPVQVHPLTGNIVEGDYDSKVSKTNIQPEQQDTSKNSVWIALQKDEETFGELMPNATHGYKPRQKDTFNITGIDLPVEYIKDAERRGMEEAIRFMADNNEEKFSFDITASRIFFAERPDVLTQLDEYSKIKVEYDGKVVEQYVSEITIECRDSEPLPNVKVSLSENLSVGESFVQAVAERALSLIANPYTTGGYLGTGGTSTGGLTPALAEQRYLNKQRADRTPHKLSTDTAFEVGEYVSGVSGGIFYRDSETGQTYIEADRMKIRMKAIFEELSIAHVDSIGGKQMITPGGAITISMVEKVLDESGTVTGYRCYFKSKSETEGADCRFVAGDEAYSQQFNISAGTTYDATNNFYWRLVTEVDNENAFVVLSADDCADNSDEPKSGDVMVQLGNRTDNTRQSAIILSTIDEFAPCVTLFHGIDRYSLEQKAVVEYGVDKTKNPPQPFFNCYGRMFIGPRTKESYLEFDPITKQLTLKGRLSMQSTYGDTNLGDYIDNSSQTAANTIKNELQADLKALQDQVDGVVEAFSGLGAPTTSNYPANEWTTDEERKRHDRDIYTDITPYVDEATTPTSGQSWKWYYNSPTDYGWTKIADSEAVKALQLAQMSVVETDVYYIQTNSQTDTPAVPATNASGVISDLKGWTTTAPTWKDGMYIWQTTYVRKGNGTASFSTPVCISGRNGKDGVDGVAGASARILDTGLRNYPLDRWQGYVNNNTSWSGINNISAFKVGDVGIINGTISDLDNTPCYMMGSVTEVNVPDKVITINAPALMYGEPGADAVQTYTWIKYADTDQGVGLSDNPTGKEYIGFAYNRPTATESNNPEDYTWSLIKGTDGQPGTPGVDGKTFYTWIKYSDNANGSGMYDIPTANTKYIGIAVNKETATEGTNPSDYTWSLFKGADGTSVSISSTEVRYSTAYTSATQPADATFTLSTVPTLSAGQYLWSRTTVTYNNGQSTKSYAVSKIGTDGTNGANYTDNMLTGTRDWKGWAINPIFAQDGKLNGLDVMHGKYSGQQYADIQLSSVTDLEADTLYTLSVWAKGTGKFYTFVYPNVTARVWKVDGKPNTSTASDTQTMFTLTPEWKRHYVVFQTLNRTDLQNKNVIACRLHSEQEAWIAGAKLELGDNDNPQWTPHPSEMAAPTIKSTSVTYAKTTSTTQPADSAFTFTSIGAAGVKAGEYLWTKTEVTYSDNSVTKSYSVSRIGSDGNDGTPGAPGVDGKTTYVHYAYANSADGKTNFNTSYFKDALYVGVCTDYNQADPTTYTSYEWSRLRGENGRGIVSTAEYYAVSSSNTTAPADSAFSTTVPATSTTNRYLWNYEKTTYSDNTFESTAKRVIGVHGQNGVDGAGISKIDNYYLASASASGVTTSTAGWTTDASATAATMTDAKPYLWNYEKVTYTKGNPTNTTPHVIGKRGVGVKSITEQYYLSTSRTTLSGGSWSDTRPAWVAGKYYWTRSKMTYTDGTVEYTAGICVTGDAAPNLLAQYSVDASSWHPTYVDGDLWMRTSTDGGATWGNAIPIVGSNYSNNLMLNTEARFERTYTTSGDHWVHLPNHTIYMENGKIYTVSGKTNAAKFESAHGGNVDKCVLWLHSDSTSPQGDQNRIISSSKMTTDGTKGYTFTWQGPTGDYFLRVNFYIAGTWWVEKVKVEEGRVVNTQWTPAASEMVGEDGQWRKFQWAKNTSTTTEPTSGWQDTPLTASAGEYVWMRSGMVVPPATNPATWDKATRLTGDKGASGDSTYQLDIENEVQGIACNSAGTVTGSYKTSTATVYKGSQKLTSGVTYSIAQATGCSASITTAGVITYSNMTADTATVTVQAKVGSLTLTATASLYKVKPGATGAAAKSVTVNADAQAFVYKNDFETLVGPSAITLTATLQGTTGYQWSYKLEGQTAWTKWPNAEGTTATVNFASNGIFGTTARSTTVRCTSGGVYDEVTIVKVSSGKNGTNGTNGTNGKNGSDGYTVILTNESHTFLGDENGALSASTTTSIIAYKGATQVPATVDFGSDAPAFIGMSYSIKDNGTTDTSVTVSVNNFFNKAITLSLPIKVDGKFFTREMSLSVSLKGEEGEDAVVYSFVPSVSNITRDANGKYSPTSFTVTKMKTTGNSGTVATTEKILKLTTVTESGSETTTTLSANGGASSVSVSVPANCASLLLKLYDTNGTTLLDSERVPVLDSMSGVEFEGRNLVRNSAFDSDMTHWTKNMAATAVAFVTIIDTGKRECHITSSGIYFGGVVQTLTDKAKKSQVYTVSWKARGAKASQRTEMRIHQLDTSGAIIGSQPNKSVTIGTTQTLCSHTFTSASNVDRFKIIMSNGNSTAANDIYITDIKLEEGDTATPWTPYPGEYSYLAQALKEDALYEGGLVLASLMKLGFTNSNGEYVETAGMNGIADTADAPAFWAGGTMAEARNNAAGAVIRHNGTAYFSKGKIKLNPDNFQIGDEVQLSDGQLVLMSAGAERCRISNKSVGTDLAISSSPTTPVNATDSNTTLTLYRRENLVADLIAISGTPSKTFTIGTMVAGSTINIQAGMSFLFAGGNQSVVNILKVTLLRGNVQEKAFETRFQHTSSAHTASVSINHVVSAQGTYTLKVEVLEAPTTSMTLISTKPTAIYAVTGSFSQVTNSKTFIGSDGFLTTWSNAAILCNKTKTLLRFGNYAIRLSANGIEKTSNFTASTPTWTKM